MNAQGDPPRLQRPTLKRSGPNRSAVNFYRAAVDDPRAVGGVTLDSVEGAVTAAVRLGYKVAQAQIDRTTRLAKRLRAAGDRATGGSSDKNRSDKQALDATEQLIFKAMMAGLSFLEGIAADRGNPLRRLATAEFRLLGSLLGLLPDPPERGRRREQGQSGAPEEEPDTSLRGPAESQPGRHAVRVRHARVRGRIPVRRAIRIGEWHVDSNAAAASYPLTFYREGSNTTFPGIFVVGRRDPPTLTVKTTSKTAAGNYKAAICAEDGLQIGYVEITL